MLECKFFQTLSGSAGFAVMTNCYQFFVVADSSRSRDEIRVKKLPDLPCKYTHVRIHMYVYAQYSDLLWEIHNCIHTIYIYIYM